MHETRSTPQAPLTLGATALAVLLCTTGCKGDDEPPAADTTGTTDGDTTTSTGTGGLPDDALTWWRDIQPIVHAKCANCHHAGEVAPFPLESYEDFVTYGPAAAWAIESGLMPPWKAGPDCNTYADSLSLSPEQRDQLLTYIDSDMPQGDPSDAPPEDPPPPELETDVVLEMPEAYTPTTDAPDDYRCFPITLPADITEDRYITGFDVYPGERSIVHHVIAFQISPGDEGDYLDMDAADPGAGYTCFGGPGKTDGTARWLGAWVPGVAPFQAPEGVGQRLEPGSTVIIQVHYNATAGPGLSDRSSIGLRLEPSVERPSVLLPFSDFAWLASDGSMLIPAGDPDVMHEATMDRTNLLFLANLLPALGVEPDAELEIWNAGLHMHLYGTRGRVELRDAGGGNEQCLLDVPEWDFDWQSSYTFEQPMRWTNGQELHLQCWWDNSAENQPIIDGQPRVPTDLDWGDGTLDEMCLGILYISAAP